MQQWALYVTTYGTFIVSGDVNLSQIRLTATLIIIIIIIIM